MADIFEDYHPRFAEVVPDGYTLDIEKQRERLWQLILDTPNLEWLLLTKRPENFKWRPFGDKWPDNVWLGVSAENQNYADERIPLLLAEDAKVRFVSFEPLVGGIDALLYMMPQFAADDPRHHPWRNGLEWNITGGESGAQARPADPNWFRRLRDDSVSMDIPFHFKQWGEFDATEERVGKHEAGRLLDGREWNQYPGYMR
jgi:protein gp37